MNEDRARSRSAGRPKASRRTVDSRTVKIDIASRLDLLEIVQTVLAQVAGTVQFDEDALHYMSVAVRESVVNAIKHGNLSDESKRVQIAFTMAPGSLAVEVHDEGQGFDPSTVPDPLAEENLLKPYGRGIFFMRSFMDEVSWSFGRKGGTVVRLVKNVAPKPAEG
jgi:serine/threonine-protein kinase RsbW